MENEIVLKVLDLLEDNTGMAASTEFGSIKGEGTQEELVLNMNDKPERFLIFFKKEFYPIHLIEVLSKQNADVKTILIAYKIRKNLREELRRNNTAYCDAAGNAFIRTRDHYILIEGLQDKNQRLTDKNRAFTKAGLKVVYFLLNNQGQVNAPYRQIAEQAGVALDTINKTFLALKTLKFIIRIDQNSIKLWDKSKLAERWINAYDETLKPNLLVGNYSFLNSATRSAWKEIKFQGQPTWWGGEPAADILTNYLNPEVYTIYTEEPEVDLLKKYRFIPDQNGEIKVYRTFWKNQNLNEKVVDPLLVYADLINTGDSRNMETAKLLYNKFLNDKF